MTINELFGIRVREQRIALNLSQEKLIILFEHRVDYVVLRKDWTINDSRLERLFKDFNI